MDGGTAKIVFNARPKRVSVPKGGVLENKTVYVPSDDPEVSLEFAKNAQNVPEEFLKVPRQRANIPQKITFQAGGPDAFGPSLDWAYRCYAVEAPPDYKDVFQSHIYLFNILVAFEWHPDDVYRQRIEWAFRRASDLLFDVTDGWMAFGQVIFGGPELMNCADIQIVASDRVLSRSWVGGMLPDKRYPNDEKYMPIRMGRGAWNSNRRDIIAWEEPEGYRTIVHEWGHYALRLTDEYLATRRPVLQDNAPSVNAGQRSGAKATGSTIVMPTSGPIRDSIMASPEGTSELFSNQWETLSTTYSRIPPTHPPRSMRAGPWRLPLSLPRYQWTSTPNSALTHKQVFFPRRADNNELYSNLPEGTELDQCWVYVLRDGDSDRPILIAQGTLSARSDEESFALLGARPGDLVVLHAARRENTPIVLCASISAAGRLENVRDASPPALPTLDVMPEQTKPTSTQAQLRIRLDSSAAQGEQPDLAWILPLGQAPAQKVVPSYNQRETSWISESQNVPTLDGHVLLRWGKASERLLISTFSQGGGPSTNNPFPENPIAAGSADGSALLFFKSETDHNGAYSHIRVVTTNVHGLNRTPPGGRERGLAYSVASNEPLPLALTPTLIMYFDPFGEAEEDLLRSGELKICRWTSQDGWVPLQTYLPPGYRFAVIPLDHETASALVTTEQSGPRVEYYKVCWVPRGA